IFFFSSRRRHTRSTRDWSSDVCSSDLLIESLVPDDVEILAIDRGGRFEAGAVAGVVSALDVHRSRSQEGPLERYRSGDAAHRQRSEERRVGQERSSRRWHYANSGGESG